MKKALKYIFYFFITIITILIAVGAYYRMKPTHIFNHNSISRFLGAFYVNSEEFHLWYMEQVHSGFGSSLGFLEKINAKGEVCLYHVYIKNGNPGKDNLDKVTYPSIYKLEDKIELGEKHGYLKDIYEQGFLKTSFYSVAIIKQDLNKTYICYGNQRVPVWDYNNYVK